MKKTVYRILSIMFLLAGILLLLEGGFHISTVSREKLDDLVPKNIRVGYPCVCSNLERKDVAVRVYRDLEGEDSYYILEFSKNTLFDKFALTEIHQWDQPDETLDTVVSSALRSYAYSVDIANGTVQIYDPQQNFRLTNYLLTLALGIVSFLAAFLRKDL